MRSPNQKLLLNGKIKVKFIYFYMLQEPNNVKGFYIVISLLIWQMFFSRSITYSDYLICVNTDLQLSPACQLKIILNFEIYATIGKPPSNTTLNLFCNKTHKSTSCTNCKAEQPMFHVLFFWFYNVNIGRNPTSDRFYEQ